MQMKLDMQCQQAADDGIHAAGHVHTALSQQAGNARQAHADENDQDRQIIESPVTVFIAFVPGGKPAEGEQRDKIAQHDDDDFKQSFPADGSDMDVRKYGQPGQHRCHAVGIVLCRVTGCAHGKQHFSRQGKTKEHHGNADQEQADEAKQSGQFKKLREQ